MEFIITWDFKPVGRAVGIGNEHSGASSRRIVAWLNMLQLIKYNGV